MTPNIDPILSDKTLSVDDKVLRLTTSLYALPDHGVLEVLQFLFSTNDPTAATFPANYLALLPDLDHDKQKVVQYFLDQKRELMISAVSLVRDMPEPIVNRLIDAYFENPSAAGMDSLIYEVAMFFPALLRKFASRITDETIREAILAGGPDKWVKERVQMYRDSLDPVDLRALGRFRTDGALQALLDLAPVVPEGGRDNLYIYIESSGVFPNTRDASVYFKTYRGRVVSRGQGPHPMGGNFPGGVPACAVCATPANRILTLVADKLELGLQTTANPTFFWINCPHPQDYVVARFTANGIEGVMTPTSPSPAATDLVPGELALQTEEHTNQFGYGVEITPGYSLHQVGGYPPWMTPERFPRCPDCSLGMRYLISVDTGMTPFGEVRLGGMLYGFWCERCRISATHLQVE